MIPPVIHEELTAQLTDAPETLRQVSDHSWAFVGIIGGAALVVWVFWLSVIRICKLKTNIASSESAPLLNPDQPPTHGQRDLTVTSTLLCHVCTNLDFHKIFLDGILPKEEIPLGSLSSILEKSYQCSFCRLISFHVRRTWKLDEVPHVDLSGLGLGVYSKNCGCIRKPFYQPEFRCHRLHVVKTKDTGGLWKKYLALGEGSPLIIHLLQEDAFKFGRPADLHGRRVKNTVDIDLMRKWISLCQENHGDKCGNVWKMHRKLPGFVRVVDVVSMAVVLAPSGCRYLTLSYVWGSIGAEYWTTKGNIAERSTPGGLNALNLPETIADSILFVRQLGERYLWIDALCIIQDDLLDKSIQLRAMDLVYGLSHLTIVAASAMTARDPLPGCRPRTRTLQQHIEVVQGLHLYVAPPRLGEALAQSTWNTRCWTYQESALSCRRIYFTGPQVYFECKCDIFCEDIVAESKCLPLSHSFLQSSFGEPFPYLDLVSSYTVTVDRYTPRNLTVESDVVDAFTGVTNALAMAFELGDPDKTFQYAMMLPDMHLALLWQHDPQTPRTRRLLPDGGNPPWPSWAWAAWRGGVIYRGVDVYLRTRMGNLGSAPSVEETLVDPWYIVDHNGDTVQLAVHQVSWVVLRANEEEHAYSAPRGILDPTELTLDIHRPLEPGTLVFRTTCSHFRISRRGGEEPSAYAHGLFDILSIASFSPIWVGTAVLPLEPTLPSSLDFIVLSRTSSRGVYDEENLMGYDGCLLNVMAVSQDEGLMERVGLGVIHEAAWVASRPEKKVVFLR
ncbi:heterokaryon incompatibility protein-domain-containing protein [Suillus discolor]|uniref:Heterokaryon incompatibility protein-domain-containing protein n=1 Tax=Suillus discolor TaxID=1912936 RepID=A0A9P7JMK7_9AGAM|nr:heterokaryon incompatibility protein-domain-containing protein [Suillus discolor]KAG2089245.1 heterokaryon incompatibility protein-domain-containing protein [Suillus discolor]